MARVCISMLLVAFLSACATEQTGPFAVTQDSLASGAKGVLACTGLPVGGQKCVLEEQKPANQGT